MLKAVAQAAVPTGKLVQTGAVIVFDFQIQNTVAGVGAEVFTRTVFYADIKVVGGAVFSCFDGRKIVKGSIVQIQLGAAVRQNQAAWCRYVVRSIAFFVDSDVITYQFLPLNLYSGALPFLMLSVSRKLL